MKIKAERGKANKIHILCDGEYTYTVDADFWYSCPYRSVQSIDDEQELAEFNFSVGSRCAFNAGLRLLGYGDHSKKELSISTMNAAPRIWRELCRSVKG